MTIQQNDFSNTLSVVDSATNADLTLTPKGTGSVIASPLNTSVIADTSSIARASGLSSVTTIAATTTYTTGGVTLPTQTMTTGAVWRVTAFGEFTAANSATARNFRAVIAWGANTSGQFSVPILINTAQTTAWNMSWTITGTSTTTAWVASQMANRLGLSGNLQINTNTPASFTVPSGAQTVDLKFSVSTVVAGDSFAVQSVIIERIE